MQQGVQLTGLQSSSFWTCANNISSTYSAFSQSFEECTLHPWQPDIFMTYPALNIYNRYFHTTQESPQQSAIPFEDNVDIDHTLAAIGLAAGLVHTADNKVEYFRISAQKKYERSFLTAQLFSIADYSNIQVCIYKH